MPIPITFWDSTTTTTVAQPTFSPAPGFYDGSPNCLTPPLTISCATGGSHIFYTKNGTQPTHTGDVATGTSTFRIGSNSGGVALCAFGGSSVNFSMVAIGYKAGMVDSPPQTGFYVIGSTGGG